jgi:hypothetical protein
MKRQFTFTILLFTLLWSVSCKKEKTQQSIIGTWQHVETIGGLQPQVVNSKMLVKFTDKNFEFEVNGAITMEGTYEITDEKSWAGDPRIIFNGKADETKQYLKVSGSKLILFYGAPVAVDGIESHYTKIK